MGQKVHPLGFRLGVSQKHSSDWFAKGKLYSQLVIEDHFLRKYIYNKFPDAGIASILINRQLNKIQISISSVRPRQLLGSFDRQKQNYTGVQELRDQLTKELSVFRTKKLNLITISKTSKDKITLKSNPGPGISLMNPFAGISIYVTKVSNPDISAACLSDFIVDQLERRINFRRALKQAVGRAERASVKGIKVQVSGRLNGAEIARSERIHKGQVPLHTLRAKMEYDSRTARTIYGLLGVKVWVFKGFL